MAVIDATERKLITEIKVGRRPRNVVFMPDGAHAYVNAENDGTVLLLDTIKNEKTQVIELGTPGEIKPMGLVLSPKADRLYVTTGRGHKLFTVDTATNKVTGSFEVGQRPWGIGISPDGKLLFTANGPSGDVSVVDAAAQTVVKKLKAGAGPWGVAVLAK